MAAAKAPGAKVTYGSWGIGSPGHLGGEQLELLTGAEMSHVAFKEVSQLFTSVATGDVQWSFGSIPSSQGMFKAGKIRYLAVAAPRRIPQMPDVPTLDESGVPGFDAATWYGIYAPHGTPPEAIRWLVARFNEALSDADFTGKLVEQGYVLVPADASGPKAFAAHTQREVQRWKQVIETAGIPRN